MMSTDKEQKLLNALKKKGVLGGGAGSIDNIKTVKNLKPQKPVSEIVIEDRR